MLHFTNTENNLNRNSNMIIIKSFSNTDDQEVLYSVLLDEEEMRLYTSFFGNLRNAINRGKTAKEIRNMRKNLQGQNLEHADYMAQQEGKAAQVYREHKGNGVKPKQGQEAIERMQINNDLHGRGVKKSPKVPTKSLGKKFLKRGGLVAAGLAAGGIGYNLLKNKENK